MRVIHVSFVAAGVAALVLLAAPSVARAQASAPLTLTEVLQLKRSGVPAVQIVRQAREYCLAFAVAGNAERDLRDAGADDALVGDLRTSCSVVATRAARTVEQAGTVVPATVVIDDDFHAMRIVGDRAAGTCAGGPARAGFAVRSRDGAGCAFGYPTTMPAGDVRVELTWSLTDVRQGSVTLGYARDAASGDPLSVVLHATGRLDMCRMRGQACNRLVPTTYATRALDRSANTANRLSVEVRGTRVRVLVNDEEVAATTMRQPPTAGVELGIGPATTATFRRLRVIRLGGEN